jgi:hypothetical protein
VTSEGSTRVPDGFSVALHSAPLEPSVQVLPSGLVLAHFGHGSDDPSELHRTIARARVAVERNPDACPRFASRARSLADLLQLDPPELGPAIGRIVWTSCGDALRVVLDGGRLEAEFVAELAALSSLGLVVDAHWAGGDRVFSALRAAGVAVWETEVGAPVLAEVARPEGIHVLASIVADARPQAPRPRQSPVWTAPRLRQVLLAALASNSLAPLLTELEHRSIPLVFMVELDNSPTMMSWPHIRGPVLPVFADLASLYQAARETRSADRKFGFAAMKLGELRQWAGSDFTVAIGVFDERGAPKYLALD